MTPGFGLHQRAGNLQVALCGPKRHQCRPQRQRSRTLAMRGCWGMASGQGEAGGCLNLLPNQGIIDLTDFNANGVSSRFKCLLERRA